MQSLIMIEILKYIAAILMWNFHMLTEKNKNINSEPSFKRYSCLNSPQKLQPFRSTDTDAHDGQSQGVIMTFLDSKHSGLF